MMSSNIHPKLLSLVDLLLQTEQSFLGESTNGL